MAKNRELSQLASFVTVNDTSNTISLGSTIDISSDLRISGVTSCPEVRGGKFIVGSSSGIGTAEIGIGTNRNNESAIKFPGKVVFSFPPEVSGSAGIITANTTINISAGSSVARAQKLIDELKRLYVTNIGFGASVTINCEAGDYHFTAPFEYTHPKGESIYIRGAAVSGTRPGATGNHYYNQAGVPDGANPGAAGTWSKNYDSTSPAGAYPNPMIRGRGNTTSAKAYNLSIIKSHFQTRWFFEGDPSLGGTQGADNFSDNNIGINLSGGRTIRLRDIALIGGSEGSGSGINGYNRTGGSTGPLDTDTHQFGANGGVAILDNVAVAGFFGHGINCVAGSRIFGGKSLSVVNCGFSTNTSGVSSNSIRGLIAAYDASMIFNEHYSLNHSGVGIEFIGDTSLVNYWPGISNNNSSTGYYSRRGSNMALGSRNGAGCTARNNGSGGFVCIEGATLGGGDIESVLNGGDGVLCYDNALARLDRANIHSNGGNGIEVLYNSTVRMSGSSIGINTNSIDGIRAHYGSVVQISASPIIGNEGYAINALGGSSVVYTGTPYDNNGSTAGAGSNPTTVQVAAANGSNVYLASVGAAYTVAAALSPDINTSGNNLSIITNNTTLS